jgi:hypothetical protein
MFFGEAVIATSLISNSFTDRKIYFRIDVQQIASFRPKGGFSKYFNKNFRVRKHHFILKLKKFELK